MSQLTFKDIAEKYHVHDEIVTFKELQNVLQGVLDDGFQKSNNMPSIITNHPNLVNLMCTFELDKIEDDLFKRYVISIKENGSLIVRIYQMLWHIGEDSDHKVPIMVNSNETKEGLKSFRNFIARIIS